MINAFRSEWVKLSRLSLIAGTIGAMGGFALLFNLGAFRIASLAGRPQAGAGARVMVNQLTSAGGAVRGFAGAATMLGVVTLVVFAANIGGEYKLGTLRFLLAGEPRRLHLLGGKVAALTSFIVASTAVTFIVAIVTATIFAGMFDVSSSGWWKGDGVQVAATTYLNVTLGAVGWGMIGGALALLLRTSAGAIGVGVGYLLVGEPILSRAIVAPVLDVEAAWFPGEVLRAFTAGGNFASSYARAAILALLYVAVVSTGASALFVRRDVVN